MEASGLGNDPDVLKAFANIAKTTMADKDLAGPSSGTQMALTPEEARAEASTIMSHPAYTDNGTRNIILWLRKFRHCSIKRILINYGPICH
jgi:hypothetical protein